MKRFLFATLLCAIGHFAYGADTDGDGLLDLIDVPGFNPNANGDVEFNRRGIQDLDGANLLINATGLALWENQITNLKNGDFQGLNNLQRLGLGDNPITNLENGAFRGLNNLQLLGLARSQITNIENGAFQGLSNLQLLNLDSIRITTIESGVFQGLSNLQELHLSGNPITSIESGAFQGLSNLQLLYLIDNPITSIESGAFQGLSNLQTLDLGGKQITNLEKGVFQGLSNLTGLDLGNNQITSLENGVFRGLNNLRWLDLAGNNIQKLNLTGATFDSLRQCWGDVFLGSGGFCVGGSEITDLILDDAVLSPGSFQAIVGETEFISNVSLVGLAFSDGNPGDISALLSISTLDNIRVDQALFDRYAAEFNAFDAIPGNTVTVVPEPSAIVLCIVAWILGWAFRQRRQARHVSS
jgi:Leucine-rich repeat (LRR) protein